MLKSARPDHELRTLGPAFLFMEENYSLHTLLCAAFISVREPWGISNLCIKAYSCSVLSFFLYFWKLASSQNWRKMKIKLWPWIPGAENAGLLMNLLSRWSICRLVPLEMHDSIFIRNAWRMRERIEKHDPCTVYGCVHLRCLCFSER